MDKRWGAMKWLLLIGMLLCSAGCTPATKVSTGQLNQFGKQMKQEMAFIKDMTIKFRPTQVEIIYVLKNELNEGEVNKLFTNTKNLVNTKQFNEEVIQGKYRKKYKEGRSPMVVIEVDANDDGVFDYQFTSIPEDSDSKQESVQYVKWFYHRDMGAMGEPYPQDEVH